MTTASATAFAEAALRPELLRERPVAAVRPRGDRAWARACLFTDALMLAAAAVAAAVGSQLTGLDPTPLAWALAFGGLVLLLFRFRGAYARRLRLQILDDARVAVAVTSVAAMTVISLRVLLTHDADVAVQGMRLWAFAACYVVLGRTGLFCAQARARRRGEGSRPTLIVGAGRVGRLVARRLREQPEWGLLPIGFLDKEPLEGVDESTGLPVLGASWDLTSVVAEHDVEQVIVTFSTAPHEVLLELARRCEALGVAVAFVPRLFEQVTQRVQVEHLGGLPLVAAYRPDPKGWQFTAKYALDRIVAAIALIVALPVLALSALAVWCSLGRPILFRQVRVGRDGRPFRMLKFRSMKKDPGDDGRPRLVLPADTAPGGIEGDDRRTGVGAFLRRTSLDELPQLLNVLKGDMSMIGPRPERPEFVRPFERNVYRYADRHRVKAGITGWAQVHGLRGRTSISDRVEWDNYYIENWSLWLDLKIALMTLLAVPGFFRKAE